MPNADVLYSVDDVARPWPMPLTTPASRALASIWPCLSQPSAHADFAVLAVDRALDFHFERGTVGAHAGQALGAQIGTFRN